MGRALPVEILQEIISNLDEPLAPYANVSPSFQRLIAPVTFAEVETSSAHDQVKLFESAFADGRRRCLLRTLHFNVELPDISEKRYRKFQNKREAAENARVFTDAVHALLCRLAPWANVSDDVETAPSFRLNLTSASPKDGTCPRLPDRHDRPAWEARNDFKYIKFDRAPELPPVACVNMLYPDGRRLDPRVLGAIARALPRIKTLDWWFYTAPRRLHPLWLGLRESMSSAVLDLAALSTLENVHLYSEDSDPMNQDWEPTSILDSAGNDRLSVALNHLSRLPRLRKLKIDGLHTLSPAVFDLKYENAWPSLEYLELEVSAIAPDGYWYFTGNRNLADRDEQQRYESGSDASEAALDSEDSGASDFLPELKWARLDGQVPWFSFRRHPDPDVFDPFVIAMASAVVRMPVLKRFECDFPQARAASIMYYGPGQEKRPSFVPPPTTSACGSWVIFLEQERPGDDKNWNPPPEMAQTLEEANHCISVRRG
ncbi:hypothetical protein Daus18300_000165 [Diaporthe australafricana]|uniref:F-box domain-containing protein n=1 Tax=Diaporthe australafricana TaxID=127596 RepID=A0ABR3Y6Y0_9PEZI